MSAPLYKIGTTLYLVNKAWKSKKHGARIIVARVVTYENYEGTVVPILVNKKTEYSIKTHKVFTNLEEAVNALKPD